MANPGYLLLELATEYADQVGLLESIATAVGGVGGRVLSYAPPGRVACLEPATVASGLLLARWSDRNRLKQATSEVLLPMARAGIPKGGVPLALSVEGLPDNGLPEMLDIPTVASVPRPSNWQGNALLVIRGTAWDQTKLDQYRDVILPMHKERNGYYEVFAVAPGQVEALSGEWRDQIFAVSRWPTRAAAEDFWYSKRYQTEAIPIRLGAGRFSVHMLPATS